VPQLYPQGLQKIPSPYPDQQRRPEQEHRDHLQYEATIEDASVLSRLWKISMPLYRRVENNARLLEFKCVEFAEELIYGQYKKK
jgi:hypothetical protein